MRASRLPVIFPATPTESDMFNWLRKRRLSDKAKKQLLIVAARSEEALIETHIHNLLDLLETLGGEIDLERAVELYTEMMSLDEGTAGTVTNRLLARIENPRGGRDARRFRHVFRDSGR